MKILYYCPEYYCRHGGRTHARGFFGALKNLPSVSESFLFPKSETEATSGRGESSRKNKGRLWFLPATIRKIIQFFRPRPALTGALIGEINACNIDAIIIRTGVQRPDIRKIKEACPGTTVCVEINSAYFDEEFPNLPLRRLFQKWEVAYFDRADAIVVVSSYLKEYLQRHGANPDKILVNQNGVSTDIVDLKGVGDVRARHGIPAEAFVIGYVGGMEAFRRLPEVVRHIADLRKAGNTDLYFIIVGDGGDMDAVQAAICSERNVLAGAVVLTGWLPHQEVVPYLSTFDVAIFPFTNAYCSPLKLFEYLGAGIPTLGPDTPAVREVFQDGVHLKLVRQDGSDFAEKVLELKADPELRKKLGKEGQRLVLSEYTWEKNAERVVRHMEKFVRPAAKPADST